MDDSQWKRFVHPRLRTRLLIFFAIAVIIIGFIVRDVLRGDLLWYYGALAVLGGIGIGFALGRLLTIKWHETEERAVSEMDAVGTIAIIAYVAIDISREWIFGHWFHGPALAAFTLAILGGALFGRGLGMLVSIRRVIDTHAPDEPLAQENVDADGGDPAEVVDRGLAP